MISGSMKVLVDKSAAMSAMFTEGKRLKAELGEEHVFDFGIGNPNVEAPSLVNASMIEILKEMDTLDVHSYTNSEGIPAVRKSIAKSLNRRFQTAYTEKNIIMTIGAAGGLNVILKVLLDAGDEVLTFAPYFGEYVYYAENAGGKLVAIPANAPTFMPDEKMLEQAITEKIKAVILNNPNNPTGVVYDREVIRKIADVLRKKQEDFGKPIYIISDEPYRELVFGGVEVPYIPEYYENTIVAYSFSKSLSLPGDRIGYLTIPNAVSDYENMVIGAGVANRILGFVNAPALQQLAVARCCDEKAEIDFYDKNRGILLEGLERYGYECVRPQGAFYLFVKALEEDDKAFCESAKRFGLLLMPGSVFGCCGYVRISYCVARERVVNSLTAFERLSQFYKNKH